MDINLKLINEKPDIFGAIASSLCVVHCLLTPFLFLSNGLLYTGLDKTPFLWSNLDFIFIFISFVAIYRSTQSTSKVFMKYALWISWVCLFSFLLNEKILLLGIPGYLTYIAAVSLSSLHIYNLKFCQCKSDNCCAQNTK